MDICLSSCLTGPRVLLAYEVLRGLHFLYASSFGRKDRLYMDLNFSS